MAISARSRTFCLPYLVAPADRRATHDLLEQMEHHATCLRASLFLESIADDFPDGVIALDLCAMDEDPDGQDRLWFQATGWNAPPGPGARPVEINEQWVEDLNNEFIGVDFKLHGKIMDLLGPEGPAPGPLTPEQFRALSRSAWPTDIQAQLAADGLEAGLPEPCSPRPTSPRM